MASRTSSRDRWPAAAPQVSVSALGTVAGESGALGDVERADGERGGQNRATTAGPGNQLARSALPRHLRDNATVYILNSAKRFEVARRGTGDVSARL